MFSAFGEVMAGWALATRDEPGEGIDRIRRGLELWEAAGGGAYWAYLRSLLADSMRRSGDTAGASAVLRDTVRELESGGGDRTFEPEVYRIQGEILLDEGNLTAAEALLRKADGLARATGTLSLSLRATTSLARLGLRRGDVEAARRRLEAMLGRFTEGGVTADHQTARSLLCELSRSGP
jgi:predicted ATPase